jgi:hypothetical protein
MATAVEKEVAKRKRGRPRNKDTASRKASFLTALSTTGIVKSACEIAEVSRDTANAWRRDDKEFTLAWNKALDIAADRVEAEVVRRAVDGVEKDVYYQGKVVGQVREYSDRMLELLIKGLKPEKFREKAIPDTQIVIEIKGKEEIEALREKHPWRDRAIETQEGPENVFVPVEIETAPSRKQTLGNPGNKGLTAEEIAEKETNNENRSD